MNIKSSKNKRLKTKSRKITESGIQQDLLSSGVAQREQLDDWKKWRELFFYD